MASTNRELKTKIESKSNRAKVKVPRARDIDRSVAIAMANFAIFWPDLAVSETREIRKSHNENKLKIDPDPLQLLPSPAAREAQAAWRSETNARIMPARSVCAPHSPQIEAVMTADFQCSNKCDRRVCELALCVCTSVCVSSCVCVQLT